MLKLDLLASLIVLNRSVRILIGGKGSDHIHVLANVNEIYLIQIVLVISIICIFKLNVVVVLGSFHCEAAVLVLWVLKIIDLLWTALSYLNIWLDSFIILLFCLFVLKYVFFYLEVRSFHHFSWLAPFFGFRFRRYEHLSLGVDYNFIFDFMVN